jgi:hypothetical protein
MVTSKWRITVYFWNWTQDIRFNHLRWAPECINCCTDELSLIYMQSPCCSYVGNHHTVCWLMWCTLEFLLSIVWQPPTENLIPYQLSVPSDNDNKSASVSHYPCSAMLQAVHCKDNLLTIQNHLWTNDTIQTAWNGTSFTCHMLHDAPQLFKLLIIVLFFYQKMCHYFGREEYLLSFWHVFITDVSKLTQLQT